MLNANRSLTQLTHARQKSAESDLQKLGQTTNSEKACFEAALQQAQKKASATVPNVLSALEEKERHASYGNDLDWLRRKDNDLVPVETAIPVNSESVVADTTSALQSAFFGSAFYHDNNAIRHSCQTLQHSADFIDWLDDTSKHERDGQWDFELLDSNNQSISLHINRHDDGQWSASVKATQSALAQGTLDSALAQKGVFVTWETPHE